MDDEVDVVVAGAGPVGLLLSIELATAGLRVLVLERLPEPSPLPKALAVGVLGREALERRGMASALAAEEARTLDMMRRFAADRGGPDPVSRMSRTRGHFGGLFIDRSGDDEDRDQPGRRARFVAQPALEAMLAERALALGVVVRRGREIVGLSQRTGSVEIDWSSPTGGGRTRCGFLCGCDGGRSAVRRLAGIAFPGTPPTMTMFQAIVRLDHPERLLPGWQRTARGMYVFGPLPGRLLVLDFAGPPPDRHAPVTREEIEDALRRISGADVRVEAMEGAGRWADNARMADEYRRGRVLLAGDAAHVHSPFGGQGLGLGLVDAANLGWKLAAVVRGDMPESLLDSYGAERRPVAQAVLNNTRAQVAVMRPDPQSDAMRGILAELMRFPDVERFFGDMIRGLSGRYDLGSDRDEVGRLLGDRPLDARGTSLHDVMRDGAGVLLDAGSGEAAALVARAAPGVRRVAVADGPSMLVRPDACVAWAADPPDTNGLADALRRWFPG